MKILETTNMPIKQIAYELGYHHTSSFVRAFERHTGVSPVTIESVKSDKTAQQLLLTKSRHF